MVEGESVIFELRYGQDRVCLTLPDGIQADTVSYRPEAEADGGDIVRNALANPIGSPPLRELARGKESAVILISDISRLCPSHLFLESLLEQLNAGGIPDSRITVVAALGTHRKQTDAELRQLAGETVSRRIAVVNHSALPEDCIRLGTTSLGTPIEINRDVVRADLRIATGNIEPHGLVGMSGGVKALVPGVASSLCIERHHSLSQTYRAIPGNTDNPLHRDLEEALRFVPVHFLFNVIANHRKEIVGAVAGHPIQAHRTGADMAKRRFIVPVREQYDVVIVSAGGHPKDMQLYQAVKTLQNAAKIAKPGGKIVLIARCPELFGNGMFQYWVETVRDRDKITAMLNERFVLGAHKIAHIDEVLKQHEVYLYSDVPPPIVELLGFHPVFDLQQTVDSLAGTAGIRAAVMPYGALTFCQQTIN